MNAEKQKRCIASAAGVLAATSMLTGCVSTPAAPSGPLVAAIQTDKFSPAIDVVGPINSMNVNGGETTWKWSLGTAVDKSSRQIAGTRLYANVSYIGTGWCHYDTAADDTATALPISSMSSDVQDCNGETQACIFTEGYAIDVSTSKVEAEASAGYQVKLSSASCNSFVLTVSPAQIQAQMQGISTAEGEARDQTRR